MCVLIDFEWKIRYKTKLMVLVSYSYGALYVFRISISFETRTGVCVRDKEHGYVWLNSIALHDFVLDQEKRVRCMLALVMIGGVSLIKHFYLSSLN